MEIGVKNAVGLATGRGSTQVVQMFIQDDTLLLPGYRRTPVTLGRIRCG